MGGSFALATAIGIGNTTIKLLAFPSWKRCPVSAAGSDGRRNTRVKFLQLISIKHALGSDELGVRGYGNTRNRRSSTVAASFVSIK